MARGRYMDKREGEEQWRTEDIVKKIEEEGDTIALVMLSGVQCAHFSLLFFVLI